MKTTIQYGFDGARLRLIRQQARISQQAAARAAGVSRQAIERYESNASKPSADVLLRLQLLLRASPEALTG